MRMVSLPCFVSLSSAAAPFNVLIPLAVFEISKVALALVATTIQQPPLALPHSITLTSMSRTGRISPKRSGAQLLTGFASPASLPPFCHPSFFELELRPHRGRPCGCRCAQRHPFHTYHWKKTSRKRTLTCSLTLIRAKTNSLMPFNLLFPPQASPTHTYRPAPLLDLTPGQALKTPSCIPPPLP